MLSETKRGALQLTKGIVEPAILTADVEAFQALAAGVANEAQQKRVGDWLLTEACRLMSDTYAEVKDAGGDERDVIFALGRRHVGILMRQMLLPSTREKAEKLTARVRPDAHETQPARRPGLRERRRATGPT